MRQTVWATRGRLKQATREELRNSRHGQRAEIESSLFVPEEAAPSLFGLYKPFVRFIPLFSGFDSIPVDLSLAYGPALTTRDVHSLFSMNTHRIVVNWCLRTLSRSSTTVVFDRNATLLTGIFISSD